MKYLFLLLLSFASTAGEYSMDVGYSQVEHAWRGPNNVATFKPQMRSTGLVYAFDNGLAVRGGYGILGHTGTDGRYHDFVLEMDYIISLELMYRYEIDDLTLFTGAGTYVIPASVRAKSSSEYDHDYDNDEGYFFGVEYALHEEISIGYRFNMYSRIGQNPYDEWTKGHGLYISYKFGE